MRERLGITKSDFFLLIFFSILVLLRAVFIDHSPDPEVAKFLNKKIQFEAQISEEPDKRDLNIRYIVSLQNTRSKVLLVASRFPEFRYGDKVEITGKLQEPKNFEGFDYVSYLAKNNINFIIYRPQIERVGEGGSFVLKNLFRLKNYFGSNVLKVVPEPNASLVSGLIFGAKQSLGEELLNTFKNVGIIHIVAVSGYNVTIIAIAILYLTAYIGKRNWGLAISAVCILLFALMVGFGSTVIRASIMAGIAILAKYLGRPNQALRALFVAGFIMLLWNPSILTSDPSFQLSFMATLGLILFEPIVSKYFYFLPAKFGLREIAASTTAVQIFLLPMLIRMSGIVSPVSFILNLLVLPIVPWAMLLGFLTGVTGFWSFGALSYFLTEIILSLAQFSEKIPLSHFNASIPLFIVLLWYLAYAILFFKLKRSPDSPRSLPSSS